MQRLEALVEDDKEPLPYERATFLLDNGSTILDCFGKTLEEDPLSGQCNIQYYVELITECATEEEISNAEDHYLLDDQVIDVVALSDGNIMVPSWEFFIDNIESYMVRLVGL